MTLTPSVSKSRLEQAREARRERGTRLDGPVFPLRDGLVSARSRGRLDFEPLKDHCRLVLELALRGYRRMIETNFPHLAGRFKSYKRGPARAVLVLDPTAPPDRDRTFFALCQSRSGTDEVSVWNINQARLEDDRIITPEGTEPHQSVYWVGIGEFLYGRYRGMEFDCDDSVLRRWIYGQIGDDFRAFKNELRREQVQDSA